MAGYNASRAELPIAKHLWTGPCSPFAIHLQGHVPLLPHTFRAVFPLCHSLTGPCSPLSHAPTGPCFPYATCLQGRGPHMPFTHRAVFPLIPCTHRAVFSLMPLTRRSVSPLIPHSRRAELPNCQNRVKPSLIYFPLLVSVRGLGSHSTRQVTDLKGGILTG